ncbi:hypothetical protein AYK20_00745 [Thermoplasmatales archaeon SG8-52-1]|nr:MAG: hypothetical protein AYK20_00745 [Thermoplasmatales archaeon SG8-52-1]
MAKKIRRIRTFARTASKSMEKKLIDNAKKLRDNPHIILPDYEDNYSKKYFDKIKKSLDKINRFNDDIKKLEKLSNKRGLEGALAGTLLLAHSEKAPYLGVAKFPTGDVSYAQRGRADKEKLIAVQYFDHSVLRLLGIKDIAQKRKLHIYSWDDEYVSTGLKPNPPQEFIDFIINKIGLNFKNGFATCKDISTDVIKNEKSSNKNYLQINWKSADVIIAICEDCAKLKKNTIFNITKYILEPDISTDFSIKVIGQVVKQQESKIQDTQNIDEYLSGKLTDIEFINKNMKHREESIRESGEKILILDGISYNTDIEEFLKALKPNDYEKKGLEFILDQVNEPIVLNNVTPNKVLEKYWKDFGLKAISSIIKDEEMSKKFFSLEDTPSDILELVFNYKERQQILSQLPKYKSLPPLAQFIDNVVRIYKTFGEKEALAEIKKRPDTPKGKSIAYAFLLAFGKAEDKKWQFSQVELEYGDFLKGYAEKLLNSEPKNYHKFLQELLVNSGSSENVDDAVK